MKLVLAASMLCNISFSVNAWFAWKAEAVAAVFQFTKLAPTSVTLLPHHYMESAQALETTINNTYYRGWIFWAVNTATYKDNLIIHLRRGYSFWCCKMKFVFALGIAWSLDRSIDRWSVARSLDRSLTRSFDRLLDRSIVRSIARSLDQSLDWSIARSIARSLDGCLTWAILDLRGCRTQAILRLWTSN